MKVRKMTKAELREKLNDIWEPIADSNFDDMYEMALLMTEELFQSQLRESLERLKGKVRMVKYTVGVENFKRVIEVAAEAVPVKEIDTELERLGVIKND